LTPNEVALVSAPWPLFNRPSVQIGALKAYLKEHLPSIQVRTHHLYLGIASALGYDLYGPISERTWLSEPPYAALLYPDQRFRISRFWKRQTARLPGGRIHDFDILCHSLETHSQGLLSQEDWKRYGLVGFSICLGQLTSTLYFIQEIKKRAPALKIVVGGSACAGQLGESLLRTFPQIDFVIRGEGEVPFLYLLRTLSQRPESPEPPAVPGLVRRSGALLSKEGSQAPRLDDLPSPDYSDYFRDLESLKPERRFLPKIPMEISRGCWWRKAGRSQGRSGCAFCNLNLQWRGYRAKSQARITGELKALVDRYQTLSISFMDNLLPAKGLEELFRAIEGLGLDLRLFAEIRATTPRTVLAAMGRAGMAEVQVGVESLSTRLLKKINKGTTAITNLEIMRNCEEEGLPGLTGNLILNFPSSDQADVEETLANVEFAFPFRPLKGIPFWLGYGSPVWHSPGDFGIKRVTPHPFYRHLFPAPVLKGLVLMIQGYYGSVRYQHRLWRPVREKLERWKEAYDTLHKRPGSGPALSYQDGRDFMIIRQRRPGQQDMTHRLKGTSRKIYLSCRKPQSLSRILAHFPGLGQERADPFLRMMVDKRLMFREGDTYLSLASPVRPGGSRDF